MKNPPLELSQLQALGFTISNKELLDEGDYYVVATLFKNECRIDHTIEFSPNGDAITSYSEFNLETLNGRNLTIEDIKFLIEIM